MTATLEARLERLKNYRTRYELVAEHPDGRRVLVRYTSRDNRRGLYGALTQDCEGICAFFGTDAITFGKRSADGATMGEWRLRFTGRTQREAILAGELPFYKS